MRSSPPLKGRRPHHSDGGGDGPGWIWGVHAGLAALGNPRRKIKAVLATRNGAERLPGGIKSEILDPDALTRMLPPGAVHQGLAIRTEPLEPFDLEEACAPADGRPVLILDQVTDPQNVGAIFRSAAAFDVRAVIMQDRKSPPLTGALAKAAAGAIERVPHVRVVNIARTIEALNEMGYHSVGLEGEAETNLAEAVRGAGSVTLVLGAEGKGLRDLVSNTCSVRARIPIAEGVESLNVSVAAAVALYEVRGRR